MTNFQKKKKKKGHFRPKKQAGAELKNKKGLFWAKIVKKIEFKGQKLTYIEKRGHFWPKKQAGAELKKKKRTFLGKYCEKKIEF